MSWRCCSAHWSTVSLADSFTKRLLCQMFCFCPSWSTVYFPVLCCVLARLILKELQTLFGFMLGLNSGGSDRRFGEWEKGEVKIFPPAPETPKYTYSQVGHQGLQLCSGGPPLQLQVFSGFWFSHYCYLRPPFSSPKMVHQTLLIFLKCAQTLVSSCFY